MDKYIGLDAGMNFNELLKYMIYCESQLKRKQAEQMSKRETDLHEAALTMYSAVTKDYRSGPPQRQPTSICSKK